MSKHAVDSKGRRSLGYFATKAYYHFDPVSLRVLRDRPISELVFYPDIYIVIWEGDKSMIGIQKRFPVGTEKMTCVPNSLVWKALRALYAHPKGGWEVQKGNGCTVFHKNGCVRPADGLRFNAHNTH